MRTSRISRQAPQDSRGWGLAVVYRRHAGDEVLGLREATDRDPEVLFIRQRDPLAEALVDLLGDGLAGNGKGELLGDRSGHRHQGHLPLPGLADPALLGELLHIARSLPP